MTERPVPDHVLALLAIFLAAYATNVSTPFLVAYRDRLNLGPTETQFVFVVYVIGILSTLLLAGPMSDRFGRRPTCVPFVALSSVASILILVGRNSYPILLTGRLLLGIAVGAVLGVGTAWVQEIMGPTNQVRAAVLTTAASFGGFGSGPAVSALLALVAPAPLVTPFVVHALATAAALPLLATITETRPPSSDGKPLRPHLGVPPTGKRMFWITVVPAAIWVFAFPSTSFALFPVLLSEAMGGHEIQVAGGAATLTALSGLLARPLLPRLGPIGCVLLGMGLGVVGYSLGAVAFSAGLWPALLPAAVCLGAASGCITAGCLALLGVLADDGKRGALTSTFYLLAYPGMSMPIAVTSLAGLWSEQEALVAITVSSVVGLIIVAAGGRVMRREQRHLSRT